MNMLMSNYNKRGPTLELRNSPKYYVQRATLLGSGSSWKGSSEEITLLIALKKTTKRNFCCNIALVSYGREKQLERDREVFLAP
jgi:hypothetical protein